MWRKERKGLRARVAGRRTARSGGERRARLDDRLRRGRRRARDGHRARDRVRAEHRAGGARRRDGASRPGSIAASRARSSRAASDQSTAPRARRRSSRARSAEGSELRPRRARARGLAPRTGRFELLRRSIELEARKNRDPDRPRRPKPERSTKCERGPTRMPNPEDTRVARRALLERPRPSSESGRNLRERRTRARWAASLRGVRARVGRATLDPDPPAGGRS